MRPTLLSLTSTRIGIYSRSTQVKFMIRSVEIDTYFNIIMIRDLVTYLLNNLLLTFNRFKHKKKKLKRIPQVWLSLVCSTL